MRVTLSSLMVFAVFSHAAVPPSLAFEYRNPKSASAFAAQAIPAPVRFFVVPFMMNRQAFQLTQLPVENDARQSVELELAIVSDENRLTGEEIASLPPTGADINLLVEALKRPDTIAHTVRDVPTRRLVGYSIAVPERRSTKQDRCTDLLLWATAIALEFQGNGIWKRLAEVRQTWAVEHGYRRMVSKVEGPFGRLSRVELRLIRAGFTVTRLTPSELESASAERSQSQAALQKQYEKYNGVLAKIHADSSADRYRAVERFLEDHPHSTVELALDLSFRSEPGDPSIGYLAGKPTGAIIQSLSSALPIEASGFLGHLNYEGMVVEQLGAWGGAWALCIPMDPFVFYATEHLLRDPEQRGRVLTVWLCLMERQPMKMMLFMQYFFYQMYTKGDNYHSEVYRRVTDLARYLVGHVHEKTRALCDTIRDAAHRVQEHLERQEQELEWARLNHPPFSIWYVTSEVLPYSKMGGVGPVAGALPQAMNQLNARAASISLLYQSEHMRKFTADGIPIQRKPVMIGGSHVKFPVTIGAETHWCEVYECGFPAAYANDPPVYLLADPTPDGRSWTAQPYGGKNGDESRVRQARFLAEGSLRLIMRLHQADPQLFSPPGCIMGQDWMGGLISTYLKTHSTFAGDPLFRNTLAGVFVHNILYQGTFDEKLFGLLGLAEEHRHGLTYAEAHLDKEGRIVLEGHRSNMQAHRREMNLLAAGIFHADFVRTTSPTFARIIQTPEHGYGLDQILSVKAAQGRLLGLGHGYVYHDMDRPPAVMTSAEGQRLENERYMRDFLARKREAKKLLLIETGLWQNIQDQGEDLPAAVDTLIFVIVTRLDAFQKGLGLLTDADGNVYNVEQLLRQRKVRLIVQGERVPGTANDAFRAYMQRMMQKYPAQVAFFDEFHVDIRNKAWAEEIFVSRPIVGLQDLLFEGGDVFLLPSNNEPFGVTLQEAHAAGMVTVASTHGGPADQIHDLRGDMNRANGILFGTFFPALEYVRVYLKPYGPEAFFDAMLAICNVYSHSRVVFERMQLNAKMRRDRWIDVARQELHFLALLAGRSDLLLSLELPIDGSRPLVPGILTARSA